MQNPVEIEDIEEMRRREGIEDAALWQEIHGLKAGNFVRLSFLTGTQAFETLLVRITSIRGSAFRGKLAGVPTSRGLANLRVGSVVTFTASHIHSIQKKSSTPEHGRPHE